MLVFVMIALQGSSYMQAIKLEVSFGEIREQEHARSREEILAPGLSTSTVAESDVGYGVTEGLTTYVLPGSIATLFSIEKTTYVS